MIKAELFSLSLPATAKVGDTVTGVVFIRNVGDEGAWVRGQITYTTGSVWERFYSDWQFLEPGWEALFNVTFPMPSYDALCYAYAGFWEATAQVTVWGEASAGFNIKVTGLPSAAYPKAKIDSYQVPSSARVGEQVTVLVTVRNIGASQGLMMAGVAHKEAGLNVWTWGDRQWLDVGGTYLFTLTFTMPPESTDLLINAWHWDYVAGIDYLDDSAGPFDLALNTSEWLELALPDVIRSALDSNWLNFTAGQWAELLGFKLPPFTFEPGRWALKGLDSIIGGVNWLINKSKQIWDQAYNAFIIAGGALTKIDDWLSYAANWWSSRISEWWAAAFEWVKTEIVDRLRPVWDQLNQALRDIMGVQTNVDNLGDETRSWQSWLLGSLAQISPISELVTAYNKVEAFFSLYLGYIQDFFEDPPGFIFDKIDNWLNEEVS